MPSRDARHQAQGSGVLLVQRKLAGTWGIRTLVRSMSVANTVELDKESYADHRLGETRIRDKARTSLVRVRQEKRPDKG